MSDGTSASSGRRRVFLLGKTTGHAPFNFDHFYGDVGHFMGYGPTGHGKSVLAAAIAISHLKDPKAWLRFFDVGGTSRGACGHAGGKFVEVSREEGTLKVNPFARVDRGAAERAFVTDLVVNYLKASSFPVDPDTKSKVSTAVASLGELKVERRGWSQFANNVQDIQMRRALEPFLPGGHYADLFTQGMDEIAEARWVTFEMEKLLETPGDAIVPLIFHYLFHRIEEQFSPEAPAMILVDEFWNFLRSSDFADTSRNLLKTARKKGASVGLFTQEIADVQGSSVFHTLATNCPTKILLPNSLATQPATAALYRELGLTDTDLQILANAVPKRDYLYVSPLGKQLFRLDLSEEELALLKAGPFEGRAAEIIAEAARME